MQFTVTLKIGGFEITVTDQADDLKEFWRKMARFQAIPTEGPGGEDDVRFRYMKTKADGYEYYSIECPSAGQEFRFGQLKKDAGSLYPKGWQSTFAAGDHGEEDDDSPAPASAPQAKAPAPSNGKKVDPVTDFWTFQKAAQIPRATAIDILNKYTNPKTEETDWIGAMRELRECIAA